jgi:diadenosine tetraphosphate (Ap4A) HIT family hydrolase
MTDAKSGEDFCFLCPENSKERKIWNHVGVTFGQNDKRYLSVYIDHDFSEYDKLELVDKQILIHENEKFYVVKDIFPVNTFELVFIPIKHYEQMNDMLNSEEGRIVFADIVQHINDLRVYLNLEELSTHFNNRSPDYVGLMAHPHIHVASNSKSENLYQKARDFFNEKP